MRTLNFGEGKPHVLDYESTGSAGFGSRNVRISDVGPSA